MFEIPLQYSINTLDGKELVPAGSVLTEDVIREIIASNDSQTAKSMSLMQFGSVRDDIFQFFANRHIRLFLIIMMIQRMC